MAGHEPTDAEEAETIALVQALRDTGDLHPLIARLREGGLGPERARDALRILVDYDPDLLVQVTLDGLMSQYVIGAGPGHQPCRETRPEVERGDTPGSS